MSILQNVKGHEDLLKLDPQEQALLCQEIRSFLVESVSKTGGHLASNLGVVELSVAIETVYNTNIDRLVFDVGHQSYVHKMLTGRQADFAHLRQLGGMAGFPKPSESDADAFVAGHASSSVSIALGMARARTLLGENYDVIAVIGDGAATGGMASEGLNDAAVSREPMVIILNDNEMSIAPNVGGFAQHLSRLRTKESYLGMKQRYRRAMVRTKPGRVIYRATHRIKDWVKRMLLHTTIFENMGLTYLGPVDGNDLQGMISLLRLAKGMRQPVLIHVHTQKGRGYAPAEQDPSKFHGIGKFDPVTGRSISARKTTYSDSFGQTMVELAEKNSRLCAISAAMPDGTGLLPFAKQYPKRLFDVGIAEEHAVSMAGGLAKQGMIPVVALYSTFLQRSYDQILQDVGLLGLHVVFAVDRAGLVGEDGETHHGVFDIGFLRQVPGMTILCPASIAEQKSMLTWAVEHCAGPVAVRYPRGGEGIYTADAFDPQMCLVQHSDGKNAALIVYGSMLEPALDAMSILAEQGIRISVIRLTQLQTLAYRQLQDVLAGIPYVLIPEEVPTGSGIYEAVAASMYAAGANCKIQRVDLGTKFATHGNIQELYRHYGLDGRSLADRIKEEIQDEK